MAGVSVEHVRDTFRTTAASFRDASEAMRARLFAVYADASEALVRRLERTAPETFTATFYGSALGQAREIAAQLYVDAGYALDEGQRAAMEAAQAALAARLAALSSHFEGTVHPFSTRPIEVLLESSPWDGMTTREVLRTTADASRAALSGDLLERARTTLAVSLAAREPMFGAGSAQARLRKSLKVGEYRAEMIARTEHARAYNLATHTDLVLANQNEGTDYRKTIVVVHDQRTDDDSLWLERWLEAQGGSIPLDALFEDGDGRRYLTPPGRPNDRCTEVPWRDIWGGIGAVNLLTGGPRGLIY